MRFPSAFFLFAALFSSASICFAESPVTDPSIPDGETISYKILTGNDAYTGVQRTARKTMDGREIYEVTTESRTEDEIVRLDCSGMSVFYSLSRDKRPDFTLQTVRTVERNRIISKADELVVVDMQGINHVLRGFPFGRLRTMRIRMAQSADFALVVNMTKEADIPTAVGTIRCYELELALDGFFGAFVPKSYIWYSKEAPHYLVKYQGSVGGPGSATMVIELTGYSVK